MGLALGNIPPHELRQQQEEAAEQKRKKMMHKSVRVSFLVRPHLPSCFTAVISVTPSTRVADLCRAAFDVFAEEALRRGDELGPLPSMNPAHYCLRRYNAMEAALGPECPSLALVTRLLATPYEPWATPGDALSRTPPAVFNAAQIDQHHLAWTLRPTYMEIERLLSAETKTRAAVWDVFVHSLELLLAYERAKRDSSRGMELQRLEFLEARAHVIDAESAGREAIADAEASRINQMKTDFESRYCELEVTMLALVEKLSRLRVEHRATMEAAMRAKKLQQQQSL
jgi:hypothetical protein